MTHSLEGLVYLFMMAISITPFIFAIFRYVKVQSFGRAFTLWTSFFYFLWSIAALSLIYEGTPLGAPNIIYPMGWLIFNAFLIWVIYFFTKSTATKNNSLIHKILKFVGGLLAAAIPFAAVSLLTISFFIFGESYHIKSGEEAWLSETEIRECIGKNTIPTFEYQKAWSTTGAGHDFVEQSHLAIFKGKLTAKQKANIIKETKRSNSKWEKIDNNKLQSEYIFNGSKVKDGTKYSFSLLLPEDNDSIWIYIHTN